MIILIAVAVGGDRVAVMETSDGFGESGSGGNGEGETVMLMATGKE